MGMAVVFRVFLRPQSFKLRERWCSLVSMTAFRVHYAVATEHGQVARSRLARRALHSEQQRRGRHWTRETVRCQLNPKRPIARPVIEPIDTPAPRITVPLPQPRAHAYNPPAKWGQPRVRDCNGRCYNRVWTTQLSELFLAGLAAIGNVRAVSRQIGVSNQTLYRHRQTDPAFGIYWMKALSRHVAELEEMLAKIALRGQREEIWYRGQLAGITIRYDHQLALQLLYLELERKREAHRYRLWTGLEMEDAMVWVRANWASLKRCRQWEAAYEALPKDEAEIEEEWGDADYPSSYYGEAD